MKTHCERRDRWRVNYDYDAEKDVIWVSVSCRATNSHCRMCITRQCAEDANYNALDYAVEECKRDIRQMLLDTYEDLP